MPFSIERNDLAAMRVDAIVVAANERLQITGGVGATVARTAGFEALQAACDEIGYCPTGSAVVTPAFRLSARFVVHAVGPVWEGGDAGERALLRQTYDSALACAVEAGAHSVALPLISAGTYGFPPEVSCTLALEAVRAFLQDHDTDIRLVLYDRTAVSAGLALYGEIASYIDDRYVEEHPGRGNYFRREDAAESAKPDADAMREYRMSGAWDGGVDSGRRDRSGEWAEYGARGAPCSAPDARGRVSYSAPNMSPSRRRRTPVEFLSDAVESAREALADSRRQKEESQAVAPDAAETIDELANLSAASAASTAHPMATAAPAAIPQGSLSEWLDTVDEPFSTTLLAIIDARGFTDAEVYKRANMSRQLFSKIRSDASYRPTKKTALALAVALRLDLDETADLLRRAGFALSNSSKADLIVEYHIAHGNYDIFEINEALYAFDQPLL